MDKTDRQILNYLQHSAADSNAQIGEAIGLSASQVSRRRSRLESLGIIDGYTARLNAAALGYSLDAVVRIRLESHSESGAEEFAGYVRSLDEVRLACAITGDADYLLHLRLTDLQALSGFIKRRLLAHPGVREVRSDVVLELLKDEARLPIQG